MSATLVTQCPNCQTRFRLSEEQLSAAAGNVRCGACLKVYNALAVAAEQQQQAFGEEPAAAAEKPADSAPRRSDPDDFLIHDDLDLDELDLEALGLDESLIDEVNPPHIVDIPLEEVVPVSVVTSKESSQPPRRRDNSTDEKDDKPRYGRPQDEPALDQEPVADKNDESFPADPYFDLHEDIVDSPASEPVSQPEAELDDLDEWVAPSLEATRPEAPLRPVTDEETEPSIFMRDRPEYITPKLAWHELDDEPEDPPIEAPPARVEPIDRKAAAAEPEPELGELDIPDIHDEPILLAERPRPARRRKHTALWTTLSGLALIALVAQFVFYNLDELAHNERTRPMLETVCLLAGCELPARVDVSMLRSSNLMVRPHPEFPNALAVDVILYNRADFAQPFPVLRMNFTDTHGHEVAARRFRPEEYLSGELAGARLMPPQTPIHVALNMLDPGDDAVSYTLGFVTP
ncbi:DUF3426 domain-containing protein [Pseudomonas sp. gcc21]|uniref:DUF3426 domain-containing protein n=1 Tax=Pseudomonas sp. gcc21 TaxID=2726989 RepID=UPI001451D5F6|nr:DUF3426 domain-containing protein [Pseudomonas sp. gcc21]QJD58960.1 DUF3426 domain-containing protein [Pseudomonas sp. gcc21]